MEISYMKSCLFPDYIAHSRLQKQGGYAVYSRLFPSSWHQSMLKEALSLFPYAHESRVVNPDLEKFRGGNPSRAFLSVPAGQVQYSLYHSPNFRSFLEKVTGLPVYLSGIQGTYSFYARGGDHLSLHRDVESCDLAVITCLQDASPTNEKGGILHLYPTRCHEPLSQIRATLSQGGVPVYLEPNHTIVMYGGIIPHLVTPVANSQVRIVSVLCFRV